MNYPIALDFMLWSGAAFFILLTMMTFTVFLSYIVHLMRYGLDGDSHSQRKKSSQYQNINSLPIIEQPKKK